MTPVRTMVLSELLGPEMIGEDRIVTGGGKGKALVSKESVSGGGAGVPTLNGYSQA